MSIRDARKSRLDARIGQVMMWLEGFCVEVVQEAEDPLKAPLGAWYLRKPGTRDGSVLVL